MSSGKKTSAPDLSVTIAGVELKNPILTASGTFGSGMEYADYMDLSRLGGITTKGVADQPWVGNPSPRICETPSGMLNAIGLQNPGVDVFMERDLAFLKDVDTVVIANVCGHSREEYINVVQKLNYTDVDMFEINISCPNVTKGGIAFGTDPKGVYEITRAIKQESMKPVIMKLSPNVTSIAEIAKAAEEGGADAISLINTITGMKIDVERQTFALANRTGGMSGPAIHPVAVRMVYECAGAVDLPIIGMGGVRSWEDAVEMMLAGASAVAVGTATFLDPGTAPAIVEGIESYLKRHQIERIGDIIGAVQD